MKTPSPNNGGALPTAFKPIGIASSRRPLSGEGVVEVMKAHRPSWLAVQRGSHSPCRNIAQAFRVVKFSSCLVLTFFLGALLAESALTPEGQLSIIWSGERVTAPVAKTVPPKNHADDHTFSASIPQRPLDTRASATGWLGFREWVPSISGNKLRVGTADAYGNP